MVRNFGKNQRLSETMNEIMRIRYWVRVRIRLSAEVRFDGVRVGARV